MLRYFQFGFLSGIDEKVFKSADKHIIHKFIIKKILFFLFMFYAVFFTAVATPFVDPHSPVIYIIGFSICFVILLRLINFIHKASDFNEGKLIFKQDFIEIRTRDKYIKISYSEIEFIEYNILSNLVIHTEKRNYSIPLLLIDEEDRDHLSDYLVDLTPERTAIFKKIWEFADAVVMAFILAIHIIQFIIQNYYIPSGSMMDTLMEGDHLFAEKITYGPSIPAMVGMDEPLHLDFLGFRDVQRGDVIIFKPPEPADQDKVFIKRCIAVEGDEFHVKEGHVYINGKKIDEPYTKGITSYSQFGGDVEIEGVVPDGMVIALGDNREDSQDSRFFGYLDKKRIRAKAFVLYFNLDQFRQFDFSRIGLIK